MAKDRQTFLDRLRDSYEYYYTVEPTEGGTENGLPLVFRAEFHARDEGYVLVKKAKIWAAESNEYVYVFSVPHLDVETAESCLDYALSDGMPRIQPHPEHKDSYIIAVFVADVIDPAAEKAVRSRRFDKSFKFGFMGWAALMTATVELGKEMVFTNKMGRKLEKHFKKLLRSEKV